MWLFLLKMPDPSVWAKGRRVGQDNKADGMNRHIYRFIAAVLAAMTIVSCNDARKSETYRLLEDVDSYIEARPDSALAVLEAPQQRKAKQRKILIFNENRDFLFSTKKQKSAVQDRLWWSSRWSKPVFQTSLP